MGKLITGRVSKQTPHQPVQIESISSQNLSESRGTSRLDSERSFMAIGEFGANSLSKKLQGLSYMLNDNLRYQVEIRVKEIPPAAFSQ